MMLDINSEPLREGFIRYLPIGIGIAIVMLVEMLLLVGVRVMYALPVVPEPAAAANRSNVSWLGNALFTQFLLPFEIAAIVLTVAIVAAIMLTLRRRTGTLRQSASAQSAVRASDRVRIVKMASAGKGGSTP
jgi:NADH-quinone oxidoreductase subunit J